jgi:hypothetical protein
MNPATKTLLWLLCVCLATIVIIIFIKPISIESFFNTPTPTVLRITTCPRGTTTYITSNGDTNCCQGEIRKGKCIGSNFCTLSPKYPGSSLQTCSEVIEILFDRRSREWCPRIAAPHFYGAMNRYTSDGRTNEWGCSSVSSVANGGVKPTNTNATFCTIYETDRDNLSKLTVAARAATSAAAATPATVISCRNMRDAENAQKLIASSTTTWEPQNPDPALLKLSFTPRVNNPASTNNVTCYDFTRAISFYRAKRNNTHVKYLYRHRYTDVQLCDGAKAYYIDGTLSASNAQGVPAAGTTAMPGMCEGATALVGRARERATAVANAVLQRSALARSVAAKASAMWRNRRRS